jgi:hypothetical protein
MTNPTMTVETLRAEYFEMMGTRADKRWTLATLSQKVEELRAKRQARDAAAAAEEAKREALAAERRARAAARGSWEEFIALSNFRDETRPEDERRLVWVAHHVAGEMRQANAAIAELSAKLLSDPVNALSWSKGAFDAAAVLKVGEQVKHAILSGITYDEIKDHALRETLRGARWPERGSSFTSNAIHESVTAAWANLVERMTIGA